MIVWGVLFRFSSSMALLTSLAKMPPTARHPPQKSRISTPITPSTIQTVLLLLDDGGWYSGWPYAGCG